MGFDDIKAAVLGLSQAEQDRLIDAIEQSRGDEGFLLTPKQHAELAKAVADSARDEDPGAPWNEVRSELRGELDAVQRARQAAGTTTAS